MSALWVEVSVQVLLGCVCCRDGCPFLDVSLAWGRRRKRTSGLLKNEVRCDDEL